MNESFLSEALKFRFSWQIHVSRWGRINFMMTSAEDDRRGNVLLVADCIDDGIGCGWKSK